METSIHNADPLLSPPSDEAVDLMCSQISDKWKDVARGLHFTDIAINSIKRKIPHNKSERLKEVVMQWKKKKNPPFTLEILLKVLKLKSVGAESLAQQLCKSNIYFLSHL